MTTTAFPAPIIGRRSAVIVRPYKGLEFSFREDGYINMTKAAKHFGKRIDNFKMLPTTAEYVVALEQTLGIRVWEAKRGGAKGHSGTWCHPRMAVFFARWLDARFAVWADLMIENILKGKLEVAPARGHEEDPEVARLVAVVDQLKAQVAALQTSGFQGQTLTLTLAAKP